MTTGNIEILCKYFLFGATLHNLEVQENVKKIKSKFSESMTIPFSYATLLIIFFNTKSNCRWVYVQIKNIALKKWDYTQIELNLCGLIRGIL